MRIRDFYNKAYVKAVDFMYDYGSWISSFAGGFFAGTAVKKYPGDKTLDYPIVIAALIGIAAGISATALAKKRLNPNPEESGNRNSDIEKLTNSYIRSLRFRNVYTGILGVEISHLTNFTIFNGLLAVFFGWNTVVFSNRAEDTKASISEIRENMTLEQRVKK